MELNLDFRYGGGPTLPRKAINSGLSQTDLAIEVYPLRLQLLLTPKEERAIVRISKKVCCNDWAIVSFINNVSPGTLLQ